MRLDLRELIVNPERRLPFRLELETDNLDFPSVQEYLNPLVIGAYVIFVVATLCSILAYRVIPLSLGPVLESTSYIYVTIFGVTIFHEKLNKGRIAALIMIIAGILVFSLLGG